MQSSGADSLEILSENLQYFFNDKIATLLKDFVQTFFEPAIKNIKDNTNEIISDQQVAIVTGSSSLLRNRTFHFVHENPLMKNPFRSVFL